MSPAAKYVTQEEFQPVRVGLERLTIRVEVLTQDVHDLTLHVADVAEDLTELRTEMNARFEALSGEMNSRFEQMTSEVNSRFDALGKVVADGHAALLSAVLALGPR